MIKKMNIEDANITVNMELGEKYNPDFCVLGKPGIYKNNFTNNSDKSICVIHKEGSCKKPIK